MMLAFACPSHAVEDVVDYFDNDSSLGSFSDFGISEGVLMVVAVQRSGNTFTFSINDKLVTHAQVPSGTTINSLGLLPGPLSDITFRIYNWTVDTCDQGTPAPTTPAPTGTPAPTTPAPTTPAPTGTPAPTTPAPTNSTLIIYSFVSCLLCADEPCSTRSFVVLH